VRTSLLPWLLALAACSSPQSSTLELVSAERHGQLTFRLQNDGPGALELDGYQVAERFHVDWHSREISCSENGVPENWRAAREPLVDGAFTGVKLRVEPGRSAEFTVNHMAAGDRPAGICRVRITLADGSELSSQPFPSSRLRGI
jgi:hypothetical protein